MKNEGKISSTNLFFELLKKISLMGVNKKSPKESNVDSKKVDFPEKVNPHDFVQIPGTNKLISKYEISGIHSDSFTGGVDQIKKKWLAMPTPYLFVKHFINLVDCYSNKKPLLDAWGNPFSLEETEEIFNEITKDDPNIGLYCGGIWLDALFYSSQIENNEIDLDIENIFKMISIPDDLRTENGFIKIENINFGPVSLEEGGKIKLCGGTGMGDTFRFYARNGKFYLDGECNPIAVNKFPRIYGITDSFLPQAK